MRKKVLSLLLIVSLIFTMAPSVAFADTDEVTATIRVESTTDTLITKNEITMYDNGFSEYDLNVKSPGYVTPLHILCEYLEKNEDGGVPENLSVNNSGFVSEIMGSDGGTDSMGYATGWLFSVNGKYPLDLNNKAATMTSYPVRDGDEIVIYSVEYDWMYGANDSYYTYFSEKAYEEEAEAPLEVELKGLNVSELMNDPYADYATEPVEDAYIYISSKEDPLDYKKTNFTTNNEGKAVIYVDTPGEYCITAVSSSFYSRPYAELKINDVGQEGLSDIISGDINALTLPEETTTHLSLPARGASDKTKITWQSSDPDVISDSGKVIRPNPTVGDKNVTMTALVSRGNESGSKDFNVKVDAYASDSEIESIIASIFDEISDYETVEGTDTNIVEVFQKIADDIVYGSEVSINSSSNDGVDGTTGEISYGTSDETGTISITCSFTGLTDTQDVNVTIPEHEDTLQDLVDSEAAKLGWDTIKNANTGTSAEVKTNLKLGTGDTYTYKVSWTSSDTDIISNYGSVYRPARSEGNKNVTLTAIVSGSEYASWMGYSGTAEPKTVRIPVTVLAYTEEDELAAKPEVDAYAETVSNHAFKYFYDSSEADLAAVIHDLNLNLSGMPSGMDVSYTSQNPSIVINTMRAKVTRPDVGMPDTTGKLVMNLSKNGYTKAIEFDTTVKALTQTEIDDEIAYLNTVKEQLTFDIIKNNNTDSENVISNLRLAYRGDGENSWSYSNSGEELAKIEYSSNDLDAQITASTVVRPELNKADKHVRLTATISSQKIKHEAVQPVSKVITFSIPALSNMLSNINVENGDLSPVFDPKTNVYIAELPYGVNSTELTVEKQDKTSTVNVTRANATSDERIFDVTMDKSSKIVTVNVKQNNVENEYTILFKNKSLDEVSSDWSAFRGYGNIGTTVGKTARTSAETSTTWKADLSATDEWGFPLSGNAPLVVDDMIVIVDGSKLKAYNKTGSLVRNTELAVKGGSTSRLAYGKGMIFVSLSDGRIQAFNAKSFDSLWISRAMPPAYTAGSTITYHNGYIYSGVVKDSYVKTDGSFFCIDVTDEEPSTPDETKYFEWEHTSSSDSNMKGYLWSGAYATDSYVLFGGDDGILVSRSPKSDSVIDTFDAGASIRSDIVFENGYAYFTVRSGQLKKVKVNDDGTFDGKDNSSVSLSINSSTSTPVIFDGKAYALSGDFMSGGRLDVIDTTTMKVQSTVNIGGYSQSSPLISTAYATSSNGNTVFLYVVLNDDDGDVMVIENSNKLSKPRISKLYDVSGSYSMGSIVSDIDGTLYFVDGNGSLNAVSSKKLSYPVNEKYAVTFDANSGTYNQGSIKTKEVYNTLKYGNMASVSRKGYTFKGWFTAKTNGIKITDGTVVDLSRDQMLYAQWTPNKYTIKYVANGGKVSKKSKKVTFGNKYGKLAKPKKKGYVFKGWYTKKKGGKKIKATSMVAITKTTKLYARWKKK